MSDRWYYRIFGQEFGPVSLDLVRTLVASGTIAPDDEVRDAGHSNWILACTAWELRDSIKSPNSEPTVERRTVRDEWYCRGVDGDFGPLSLTDLIQLAAIGDLKPNEDVKATSDDYWKQVCSIRRLVELLPFSDRSNHGDRSPSGAGQKPFPFANNNETPPHETFDHNDIFPFPGVRSTNHSDWNENDKSFQTQLSQLAPNSPALATTSLTLDHASEPVLMSQQTNSFASVIHPPQVSANVYADMNVLSPLDETDGLDQLEAELSTGRAQWSGWIAGKEFGPIEYSELLTWAVTGQLSPMDFVRRGDHGQYVPAVNIPCLFTVHAAANSLSRRIGPSKANSAESS